MIQYERTTAPTERPVSLQEAKAHMRVEIADDDALIIRLIEAAARYIEARFGLALVTQTWKATLDEFPVGGLKLRPHPVSALSGVSVWDGTTLAAASLDGFQLVKGRPAALYAAGSPPVPARPRAGIEVSFTAGFGANETTIPAEVKQAVLLLVAHWYENREASTSNAGDMAVNAEAAFGVAHLLTGHISPRLA